MQYDKTCDECGRIAKRIYRRYLGRRYCSTCYTRVFIKQRCTQCFATKRLPRDSSNVICQSCENNQSCVRCGSKNRRLGRISLYGPVCASCAPYFRPHKPCEVCGLLSQRLTQVSRYKDGLKRCQRCATADHRTCDSCLRYRRVEAFDGKKLCTLCINEASKICPDCKILIPAGLLNNCRNCYWNNLLKKRVALNSEQLENLLLRQEFINFSEWLSTNLSSQKAAIRISKYANFFQSLELVGQQIPLYPKLLEIFGADYLRRNKKILHWLSIDRGLLINEQLKKDTIEEHRIQRMLSKIPDESVSYVVVFEYEKFLRIRLKSGKICIRTLRCSLSPAIALMNLSGHKFPTNKTVNKYIEKTPGQTASLTGFVSFLSQTYMLKIRLPPPTRTQQNRKRILEKMLITLFRKNLSSSEELLRSKVALEFFHDIKVSIKSLREILKNAVHCDEGTTIIYKNKEYFLPSAHQ